MFTEDFKNPGNRTGWIEVITGSMFSGKTEELIRRLKRSMLANQKTVTFKPALDTRYSETELVSHDSNSVGSIPVKVSEEILNHIQHVKVVGIDEAQFFDDKLPEVCNLLASKGIRVIVAGLDMDYLGKPFGPVPALLAIAEDITKVHAICPQCGNLAQYTHRKTNESQQVLLGEKDIYEPLCRKCYTDLKQ